MDFLTPLKKPPRKHNMISFDVESYNRDNDFYMVGVIDDRYKSFYDKRTFWEHMKHKDGWVIATNLMFDLSSVAFKEKEWFTLNPVQNSGMLLFATKGSLVFLDTLNYHKASVQELGKVIGKNKLEAPEWLGQRKPHNNEEKIYLEKYNKRDCEISKEFMEWFQKVINDMGGELKRTIASTSMDIYRRKFLPFTLVKEDRILKEQGYDINARDKIFRSYYGGRTEVLKRGFVEHLNYYDFNSLYPSVMINHFPLPQSVRYVENGDIRKIMTKEGISHVDIEHHGDELPLLPYRYDGKLIFPSGRFKGWYTHLELRKAVDHGYIIHDVFETIYYAKVFRPFDGYVSTMYKKRLEAKKRNDGTQLIYKLLMNSLYGKFAERIHRNNIFFDLKDKNNLPKHDGLCTLSDHGIGYYTKEEECLSGHSIPILSSYVTAYGRIKLWEYARVSDPYYMDTDSLVTHHDFKESDALGELEREMKISKAMFIKPKMYAISGIDKKNNIIDNVKIKGVPRADKDQLVKILKNQSIYYDKFVKINEGLRRNLKVNSVIRQQKNISLEDDKRTWDKDFNEELQLSTPKVINC